MKLFSIFIITNILIIYNIFFLNNNHFTLPTKERLNINEDTNEISYRNLNNGEFSYDLLSEKNLYGYDIFQLNGPQENDNYFERKKFEFIGIEQQQNNLFNSISVNAVDYYGKNININFEKPIEKLIYKGTYVPLSKFDRNMIDRLLDSYFSIHRDDNFYYGFSNGFFLEKSFNNINIPKNLVGVKIIINNDSKSKNILNGINIRFKTNNNKNILLKISNINKQNNIYYGYFNKNDLNTIEDNNFLYLNHIYLHSKYKDLTSESKIISIDLISTETVGNTFYTSTYLSNKNTLYLLPINNYYFNKFNIIFNNNKNLYSNSPSDKYFGIYNFKNTSNVYIALSRKMKNSHKIYNDDFIHLIKVDKAKTDEIFNIVNNVNSVNFFYQIECKSKNINSKKLFNIEMAKHELKKCFNRDFTINKFLPVFSNISEVIENLRINQKFNELSIIYDPNEKLVPLFLSSEGEVFYASKFSSSGLLAHNEIYISDDLSKLLRNSGNLFQISKFVDYSYINYHYKKFYFDQFKSFLFVNFIILLLFSTKYIKKFEFFNFDFKFYSNYINKILIFIFTLISLLYFANFYLISMNISVFLYLSCLIFMFISYARIK